jgi:hypothetical protein
MKREREDLKGVSLSATYKPMPSGEERWRLRPQVPDLQMFAMHYTKEPLVPKWQEAHWHGGLLEHYWVLSGKIGYVMRVSEFQKTPYFTHGVIDASSGPFSFLPGDVHNIFPGPDAEFVTIQQYRGTTLPNPDRKGEDWWPADEAFNTSVNWSMAEVEKTF